MKQAIQSFIFLLFLIKIGHSQIVTYVADVPSGVAPNMTAFNATRVNGATAPGSPCAQGLTSTGTSLTGTFNAATTGAHQFKLKPNPGYKINITSFQAGTRRSGTGAVNTKVSYSLDGGATWTHSPDQTTANTGCLTAPNTNGDWDMADFEVTDSVLFRVYMFNASSGTGSTQTHTMRVNGSVSAICSSEPTTQATNITFGTITSSSIQVNFTPGSSSHRIVVARASSPVNWTPTDGVAPSGVNSVFSSATDQGLGNRIVYAGTASTVTVTGLNSSTTYYFQVFEYCFSTNDYLIATGTNNDGTQNATTNSSSSGPTTLYMGDIALVAVDANYSFGGDPTCDKICFVNMVDLNPGTEIIFTDCGYERGQAANV
ncbi:MAG: fibronectin type III domain-containing protein, partial [Bacteroidia bacterium]|nr:fibronectin type III domain-containing protein [Bacteroidia bacterium]